MNSKILFYYTVISVFTATLSLFAQTQNSELLEYKSHIKTLLAKDSIQAANTLINKNISLDPAFSYESLTNNLTKAKSKQDASLLANTYFTLGNFWHTMGNKSKAFENYLEAENYSKKSHHLRLLGSALRNRATLTANLDERIKLLEESIKIFDQTKDKLNSSISHMAMGLAYSSKLDWNTPSKERDPKQVKYYKEKAFEHYKIVEKNNQEMNDPEIYASLQTSYGEWFLYEGELNQAETSFANVVRHIPRSLIKGKVNALIQLSYIHQEKNEIQYALNNLKEADSISAQNGFNDHLATIYEQYASLYEQNGDLKNTLLYTKKYTQKLIELNTTNNEDKIHIVELEHHLSENELKIERYKTQSKYNKILMILALICLISLFVFAYLMVKNHRRKIESLEKSNIIKEIQMKNQQLEDDLLKEKVSYVQNHLSTVANLSNKILHFLDELKTQVKELSHNSAYLKNINDLKVAFSNILNDKSYLTELNAISSELNQDFFVYLRKNYPSVTKKDEQLFAFIILKMSSKEIGEVLNISTESVYIKRHRLRKKLNLDINDSMIQFYEKIIAQL